MVRMIGSRFTPEVRRALRIDISATLLFTVFAGLTGPFIGLILRPELGAVLGIGLALAAGQLFEHFDYRWIFAVAALLGMAASLRQRRLDVPQPDADGEAPPAGLLDAWRAVCDDHAFRRLLIASFLFG